MALVPAQPDPRYPLGTHADYAKLMHDAAQGVAGALETVKYYQALARGTETICDTHDMPVRVCGPRHRSFSKYTYTAAAGSTAATTFVSNEVAKRKDLNPAPVPEGVHFTQHKRVGDETRDLYLNHLGLMYADGHIDEAEYQARTDAAIKMLTKEELEFLIQDLPRVPKEEPAPAPAVKKREVPWPGTTMSGIFFLANVADAFMLHSTWYLFAAFALAWGILFVISCTIRYRSWKR